MWKIKDIEVNGNVVLAPMAGITNIAYREFMKPFGVAVSYTEMVSDCGLIYKNQETYRYLETSDLEHPVGIQLFGGSKETLLSAIEILENTKVSYDFIDINLGCPVPKVTKQNAGSAWLKDEDALFDMMQALVKKSKKPITAKIRLGWDDEHINFKNVVKLLELAGVSMIAIHSRTKKAMYTGVAHHELLKGLKETMSVPLVISGDVFSLEDAIEIQKMTHADAIMVARGGLGNPFLIRQIDHYYRTGEKLPPPSLKENLQYLERHYLYLKKLKGEKVAICELRGIAPHYLKGYPYMKGFRYLLSAKMETEEDFYQILKEAEQKSSICFNECDLQDFSKEGK